MKFRLIMSSIVLFIIALGFNIFFNLTSFNRLYVESIVSQYRVLGKDIQKKIETGLKFGKRLKHFTGIEKILQDAAEYVAHGLHAEKDHQQSRDVRFKQGDVVILIVSKEGGIIYGEMAGSEGWIHQERFARLLEHKSHQNGSNERFHYMKHEDIYYTSLPIREYGGGTIGNIYILLQSRGVNEFLSDVLYASIRSTLLISFAGLALLILLLRQMLPSDENIYQVARKRMTLIIFFVIGSTLVLTCTLSGIAFKNYFLKINKENTQMINENLGRDVEYVLDCGLRLERLHQLDKYLGGIIESSPELESITLFDHTNQPLYRATKKGVTDFQRSKDCYAEWLEATREKDEAELGNILRQDLSHKGEFRGYFSTSLSNEILLKKLLDNVLDTLAVFIISLLLFVEFLILIFQYLEAKLSHETVKPRINYSVMRPAIFLFLFGIDISVSFLPLHMENLYEPFWDMTKETVMGLPISVEFLFVGIAILLSGIWLDRRGWHEPFIVGVFIAILGTVYSWASANAFNFIVSRAVLGTGYGLALMASQGFVITYTDWKTKAQGLAHLFAGIYAGSICGTATGGMLSEWIGYQTVFLIGAAILCCVAIYAFVFMRTAMEKPVLSNPTALQGKRSRGVIFDFIFNRTILGLIFFSSMPAAIAVIGFLNYFSPIYLNRIGASQSTIGQVLMLYGICLIYCGPFFSRYVDSSPNKKNYILLGCFLGSAALLSFCFFEGLTAAVVAVILLGFSSSFVLASQSVYALKLKVTRELGEGKAIGIFRSTSRVGQMLGPLVFSGIIVVTDIKSGITYLGLAYLLTALLFLLVTYRDANSVFVEGA